MKQFLGFATLLIISLIVELTQSAYYVGFQTFMGDSWDIEEASSWTVTNTQCPKTKYSVTRCGKTQILGGYNCLAKDATISRSFTLPHHWSVYIKVSFWLIDSWDSEYLIMKLGSLEITELRDHSPQDDDLCGATGNWLGLNKAAYYDRKYDKTLENNPHYDRSVTAVFTSNLDGTADDESFGINNFQLLIDPCNPTCDKCLLGPESFNCLTCWANATFIKYSDGYQLCSCSATEFYYAKKGDKCKKCPVTNTELGFCKCNDGFYTVSKNVPCSDPICTECKACDPTCKLCSGPGPTSCITCAVNLYKQYYSNPTDPNYGKTLCVNKCISENYYIDQVKKECTKCDPSCKTCDGSLSAECLSCPSGQYLDGTDVGGGKYVGFCVSSCSQGYYKNNAAKRCMRCNINCIDCKDDQPDYCTECKTKLCLKDGVCYTNCPDGYWNDTPNKLCKKCNTNCNTCLNSGGFCTSCIGSYYFLSSKNDCLNTCPNGMYKSTQADGFNYCNKCDNTCLTCSGGSFKDCLSCDPVIGFLKGTICTACNTNQYGDTSNQTCQPCHASCTTCEGPADTQCRSCSGSLFYFDKKCSDKCPDSTYPDTVKNICAKCDDTCTTCSQAGPDKCKTCPNGRFFKNNSCQTSCDPIGEFPNSKTNLCEKCSDQCVKCKDASTSGCLSCHGDKYLQANQCVDNCLSNLFGLVENRECLQKCPDGYYGDIPSKQCQKCNPLCPICSAAGLDSCSKCSGDLFLEGASCKQNCQKGYYGDSSDNTCKKCDKSCLECTGGTTHDCTKCISTQFLGDNTCYSKCPNNQYGDLVSMTCVVFCPLGTYGNNDDNLCRGCHSNCVQCFGPSYSQCQKCTLKYYNLNGICDLCPSGYYGYDLTRTCEVCFDNCTECTGGAPNECLKCSYGSYYLKEKKMCVSTCPAPYFSEQNNPDCTLTCSLSNQYPEPILRKCEYCNSACTECFGPYNNNCRKCSHNYFYHASATSCLKSCLRGYFDNIMTSTCDQCDKSCATCSGALSDQCLSCQEPYILYQNQCKLDCPEGLFQDQERLMCVSDCTQFKSNRFANLVTRKCVNCHANCLKCTGPSNNECLKCSSSHLSLGTACLDRCPFGYYAIYKDPNDKTHTIDSNPKIDDCAQCHESCEDCYGSSQHECRSCKKGLYLHFSSVQSTEVTSCLAECPDKFLANKDTMTCDSCSPYTYLDGGICKNCHYSCLQCSGPTKYECLQCSSLRSVDKDGIPSYGQCNCKEGFMESYSHDCEKESTAVKSAGKSITVSLITSGCCSIITGLLGTSAFSFHQIIEISQFTSSLRYANISYPLNINSIFESITTDQANEILDSKKSVSSIQNSKEQRLLVKKNELEFIHEVGQVPQIWTKFIFTLALNFLSWVIVIIINIIVLHFKIKYDKKRTLEKLRVILQYTLPIQVFIRTAQEGFQFIILSYQYSSTLDFFGWLNCVYMTLTALAVFGIILKASFLRIQKKKKKSIDEEDEYIQEVESNKKQIIVYPHSFRTLWYFFKDNRWSRNYYLIMLITKLSYIIVLMFSFNVLYQMISMVTSKIVFLIYLAVVRPFKYKWYNIINIFNECLSSVIPITVLIMQSQSQSQYQTYGWLIIIQLLILFLVNFVYAVLELVTMLKRIILSRLKKTKQIIQVNAINKINQSANGQSILYDKSTHKKITLANDIEKGHQSVFSITQKEGVKSHAKSAQLQVIQLGQSNQVLQQSFDGPSISGLGLPSNNLADEFDRIYVNDESYQESPIKIQKGKVDAEQEEEEEDYNLNSSSVKELSVMRDDTSLFNENDESSGFPLQMFGKQLEEKQLTATPIKRKKKNRKKEHVQFSQPEVSSNKVTGNNINEEQIQEIDSNLNSSKSSKQQNENQENEGGNQKEQRIQEGLSSQQLDSQRNHLDLIKVIEEQSCSQIRRLIDSSEKGKREQQQLSSRRSRKHEEEADQNETNSKFLEDLSSIHQDDNAQTIYSTVKDNKIMKNFNDTNLEKSKLGTQTTDMSQLVNKQKKLEPNKSQPIINTQKQQLKQDSDTNSKVVYTDNLQKRQKNKTQNEQHQQQSNEQNNNKNTSNTRTQSQKTTPVKKRGKSPMQVVSKDNSLFIGPGEFKITRILEDKKIKTTPERTQQQKSIVSNKEEDNSKSILEYIKNQVMKTKETKQSN